MIRSLHDADNKIKNNKVKNTIIFSMDVCSLYPSLEKTKCRSIIENVIKNSEVEMIGVDWREVILYLMITEGKEEMTILGLSEVLPIRSCEMNGGRKGRKVTLTYLEKELNSKGEQKWNWDHSRKPTNAEKKVLMSIMLGEAVESVMGNHVYIFDGKVYRQEKGGPIGLELTGVVADITMLHFDQMFLNKVEENGYKVHLYKRYVDDILMVVEATIDFNRAEVGREKEVEKKVAEVMRTAADDILPDMLKFEVDTPSLHANGRLPVLDIEVWVGPDHCILHSFYKKSVATTHVVMARSALSASAKRAILVAEGVRRLRNCHPDLPVKEKAFHMNNFNLAMMDCGHEVKFREIVNRRAIAVYERACVNEVEGNKRMYRTKEERRALIKLRGDKEDKTAWFRRLGYQNTLMVPASMGGELMRRVKEAIDTSTAPLGFKTLVVEDGGRSLKSDVIKSNPFPVLTGCGQTDCIMCAHEPSHGKCQGSNVVYKLECTRAPCNGEDVARPTYVGESCRTPRVRGAQHLTLYMGKKDNSYMWKHCQDKHGGQIEGKTDFKMTPLERSRNCLTRIVNEAVRIRKNEGDPKTVSMNSKMEYFGAEYVRPSYSKGPVDQW